MQFRTDTLEVEGEMVVDVVDGRLDSISLRTKVTDISLFGREAYCVLMYEEGRAIEHTLRREPVGFHRSIDISGHRELTEEESERLLATPWTMVVRDSSEGWE